MTMNENKLKLAGWNIFLAAILVFSTIIMPIQTAPQADAASTWTQDSDSDFANGTLDNVEIVGSGAGAEIRLLNATASKDKWMKKNFTYAPCQSSGYAMATVYGTNKIVYFGGYDGIFQDYTFVYDLNYDTWNWKSTPTKPSGRFEHAMATIHGTDKVLLFGGMVSSGISSETWLYDLSSNTWTKLNTNNTPSARFDHAMASVHNDDKVLLFGGYDSSGFDDETWLFDLSAMNWTKLNPKNKPSARSNHKMAAIHNQTQILLFGGYDLTHKNNDDTYMYNFFTNTWYHYSPITYPTSRSSHGMATIYGTNKVLLFGGWDTSPKNDTWIFDDSTGNWTEQNLDINPGQRSNHSMVGVWGTDKVILFGGMDSTFNNKNDTWQYSYTSPNSMGSYMSEPLDTGTKVNYKTISWAANLTGNSSIKFRLRTANYKHILMNNSFLGPSGSTIAYYTTSPATIWSGHYGDRWVQYKAYFFSGDKNETPSLQNVTLTYNKLPITQLVSPWNDVLVLNNTPLFKWNFQDADSVQQAAFQVIIDHQSCFNTIDFDSGIQSSSNQFWQFPAGNNSTGIPKGKWYWKVRTKDSDGDWGEYSNPFRMLVNLTEPNSTIHVPYYNAYYQSLNKISGSAWPVTSNYSKVVKVEIYIKRLDNNNYWNGTLWDGNLTWLLANGTTSWQYDSSSIPWSSGISYYVVSRATDNRSKVEANNTGRIFSIDRNIPYSSINVPANNSVLGKLDLISGNAADTGGAGIKYVQIIIQRMSDGYYWQGHSWGASIKWFYTYGTYNWYYNTNNSLWSNNTQYRIRSRAIDRADNMGVPGYGNVFTINYTYLPQLRSIITQPVNNTWWNRLSIMGPIKGFTNASMNANITKVEVCIKRLNDNTYWYNLTKNWTYSQVWLTATGTSNWYYNSQYYVNFTSGLYLIQSRATDNYSNLEIPSAGIIVKVDLQYPLSFISYPKNNNNYEAVDKIYGTASDSGYSGLKKVEICIQRQGDNKFWDGSKWVSTFKWLKASGKSSWTYSTASVPWTNNTKYNINSRAIDNADNVEEKSNWITITIKFKKLGPRSTITVPVNNSVLNDLDSCSGTASVPGNRSILKVEISIKRLDTNKYWTGTTWKSSQTWLLANGTYSWSYDTTAITWSSKTYYLIQSRATDNFSVVETPDYGNRFYISVATPYSLIYHPINNTFLSNLSVAISGIAWVVNYTSIKFVEINIKRCSDNYYWDGTGWNNTKTWLKATGTKSWSYDTRAVTWSSGLIYIVQSRATDNLNNVETPRFGNIFMIDMIKPSSAISYPPNNSSLTLLNTITGTAVDTGGAGIKEVKVCVRRTTDYYSWGGTTWVAYEVWLPTFGTTSWVYYSGTVPWKTGVTYEVRSQAKDNANNIETPRTGNQFTFVKNITRPSSTITQPKHNSCVKTLKTISGTATAYYNLSITKVEISIKRLADYYYWNGTFWTPVECWLSVSGTTSWNYDASKISWGNDNLYNIRSKATDSSNTMELPGSGNNFRCDNKPPTIQRFLINYGAPVTKSSLVNLEQFAKDTGSGVYQMAFSQDGVTWTTWEKFENYKQLNLTSGDGNKVVFLRVKDKADNVAVTNDSIKLDTTPPQSLSIIIDNGSAETSSRSVSLSIDAKDNTSGVHQMAFSNDGKNWSAWENFTKWKQYYLPAGDGLKTVYLKVKDGVGLEAGPVKDTIILNTTNGSLGMDADSDGVPNYLDAFPMDPAASLDSDGDKHPDCWNPGKSEKDSTTGLTLDAFPMDSAASLDSDGDKHPDCWNPGYTEQDSNTGLKLDAFPNDPNEFEDSDQDGAGDNTDAFPEDAAAAVDSDGDKFPDFWNPGKSESDSVTGLEIDEYPLDPTKHKDVPEQPSKSKDNAVMVIIFVIIILMILLLFFILVRKNKQQLLIKKQEQQKILEDITYEILHDKVPENLKLSKREINKILENRYEYGDVSDETYEFIKKFK
ncbi:Kelch repeat-containing protein [[Eubacterium] cellulosolvens]